MKVTPPINTVPIGTAFVGGVDVPVRTHPEYVRFFELLKRFADSIDANALDSGETAQAALFLGLRPDAQQELDTATVSIIAGMNAERATTQPEDAQAILAAQIFGN